MTLEGNKPEESQLFDSQFRSITDYRKNEVIFQEGARGREMFVIYSGEVRISKKEPDGSEITLSTLKPGEFFGEMTLIDQSPRSATATALTDDTRLIVLDRARFMYLLRYEPEFALIVMETLCERIREKNEQYAHLLEKVKPDNGGKQDT